MYGHPVPTRTHCQVASFFFLEWCCPLLKQAFSSATCHLLITTAYYYLSLPAASTMCYYYVPGALWLGVSDVMLPALAPGEGFRCGFPTLTVTVTVTPTLTLTQP